MRYKINVTPSVPTKNGKIYSKATFQSMMIQTDIPVVDIIATDIKVKKISFNDILGHAILREENHNIVAYVYFRFMEYEKKYPEDRLITLYGSGNINKITNIVEDFKLKFLIFV